MGLDITVYKNAKFIQEKCPDDNDDRQIAHFYNNGLSCCQNVMQVGFYEYSDYNRVYSRPYSSFNTHRRLLCGLIGTTDELVWENPVSTIPFIELINFSDCQGAFDTQTCEKLYKDFEANQQKADESENDNLKYFYSTMKNAFKEAAENNGFVKFD